MKKSAIVISLCVMFLLTVGIVMLASTSQTLADEIHKDHAFFVKRQVLWLGLGLIAFTIMAMTDYHFWRKHAWHAYGIAVILLICCLIPGLGIKVNGAYRWLGVGGFRMQPSDLAKYVLILVIAHLLDRNQRKLPKFTSGFLWPIGVMALILGLIFLEPDYGTTALVAFVVMIMMFIAGVRLLYMLPVAVTGLAGFAVAIMLNPNRLGRIMAYLDLEKYKEGKGYQVYQAILAFGSGGTTGLGLGNSRQKMFYLPEAHTDFISAIIGEELGVWMMLLILVVFLVLFISGLRISSKAPDLYGMLLGVGITTLITFQAAINLGVVTGALPNKGLPLPFISYGGSNLFMNLVGVGLLISIARNSGDLWPARRPASHDGNVRKVVNQKV